MLIPIFIFVGSGVLQPILVEVLAYNGLSDKTTLLYLLPNYIGMAVSFLFNHGQRFSSAKTHWVIVAFLCVLDMFSQYLNFTGLVNAGSLIYTVIYSSVTVYTAIFSYIFLQRKIHTMQWVAVFVIMSGLVLGGCGASDEGKYIGLGVLQILFGSMFHALTYIISEYLLTRVEKPISAEMLSTLMGTAGVLVFGSWQFFYTIPHAKELVIGNISLLHGNVQLIFFSFFFLVLDCLAHALCFYNLLGSVGSVTTGVMKGVQTVLVFVFSHFFFCKIQQSQCFTVEKGFSLVTVVFGVLLYSSFQDKINTDEAQQFLAGEKPEKGFNACSN